MKKLFLIGILLCSLCYTFGQKPYMNIDYEYNNNIVAHKDRILAALDSLLLNKDSMDYVFTHFTSVDQKLWGQTEIYRVFRRSGLRYNDKWELIKDYFKPTILGIIDVVPEKKYLIKVAYTSHDDSSHNSVQHVYNFVANYEQSQNKVEFEMYTDWYLRDWYRTSVGKILFYKQNKSIFSMKDARAFSRFNDSLSQIFKMPLKSFVYFSCKDPFQLFNLKGYDYDEGMFYARNGGLCVYGGRDSIYQNIIFSANNKEIYKHEMAHYYITDFNGGKQPSKLADEGIATFLGGSAELPLSHHLHVLRKYVDSTKTDMTEFFEIAHNKMIDADVAVLYATGGLLAKLIYQKKGLEGWRSFLKIPEDKMKDELPKLLELKNGNLSSYLKDELNKY